MKQLSIQVAVCFMHLQFVLLPFALTAQFDSLSNFRYYDKRGINVFEAPKQPVHDFTGFKMRIGGGFAQTFQALSHRNSADSKSANSLYGIRPGFNTAMANLSMSVDLMAGVRFNIGSYLASRRHHATRLNTGYFQLDKLPFNSTFCERLMKVMTIKLGLMEINYGDAHFRRSDGGQTIHNAFMDNYILDSYTREIATEFYARKKSFFAMAGISNGMNRGNVDSGLNKSPAMYVKAGIDKSFADWFRIRLAASFYHNASSGGNTLFTGDLAGSNYFMVMEKDSPNITYATNAFSGRLNPDLTGRVNAYQFNGFFKLLGLELFATYEAAGGRSVFEEGTRHIEQFAIDWVFRFGSDENLFIGSRYNMVTAQLQGIADEVKTDRVAFVLGGFITKNILLKCEFVDQLYKDFPLDDYRNNGEFRGFILQAVVGF